MRNLAFLETLGDWNPQLLRELKGRLKPRNIFIATAISLLGQLLVLMNFSGQLPDETIVPATSRYCLSPHSKMDWVECVRDSTGSLIINWPRWWMDVFVAITFIGILAFLVVGTYLLISDLSKEENRGTLNFIRLSPRSTVSILSGKLIGVPVLLYLMGLLALPLHLWAATQSGIPLAMLLGFYGLLAAAVGFFWSFALLLGLIGHGLAGFQSWLGSGVVLMFASVMQSIVFTSSVSGQGAFDWLNLFTPSILLPYLLRAGSTRYFEDYVINRLTGWQWFNLPLGESWHQVLLLALVNLAVGTWFIWQVLQRCFQNSHTTLLSKQQSYWLTAAVQVMLLGFSLELPASAEAGENFFNALSYVLMLNFCFFLVLTAILSPHRQTLQDWARYRHLQENRRFRGLGKDLIWGEKSPALVAIALNLVIAVSCILPWIFLWRENVSTLDAVLAVVLTAVSILMYATLAQSILLSPHPKRALWAACTVLGLVILPPVILGFLSFSPYKMPDLWMLTPFSWAGIRDAAMTTFLFSLVGQSLVTTLLSLQLSRRLKKAGESATQALMAGRTAGTLI